MSETTKEAVKGYAVKGLHGLQVGAILWMFQTFTPHREHDRLERQVDLLREQNAQMRIQIATEREAIRVLRGIAVPPYE